ncbi:hypothetical protein EYF80_009391 [Liparis tanakae]|uniref:Uncharacterized protein n=1 Tax=Liparis tanakae TaxID=230148 RepID=A0A4Z2IRI3_9TELE|nr:hypothetical protein EYF80_009391 [Liparis tanakae]
MFIVEPTSSRQPANTCGSRGGGRCSFSTLSESNAAAAAEVVPLASVAGAVGFGVSVYEVALQLASLHHDLLLSLPEPVQQVQPLVDLSRVAWGAGSGSGGLWPLGGGLTRHVALKLLRAQVQRLTVQLLDEGHCTALGKGRWRTMLSVKARHCLKISLPDFRGLRKSMNSRVAWSLSTEERRPAEELELGLD